MSKSQSEFFLSCQHTEFDLPHGKIFGVLHTQELQQFCATNEHNTLVGSAKHRSQATSPGHCSIDKYTVIDSFHLSENSCLDGDDNRTRRHL